MNLAEYSRQAKSNSSSGAFVKWTQNGEVKVLRFLYTSSDGSDISVVKKCWDDGQKRFVYDTPEGKLTCVLNAVLYESGQEPKLVRWERSAAFVEQVCNGYWSKFPRIIDGVWEVTCTNPGTKEIKFAWFPIMGADLTTYPLPEGVSLTDGRIVFEQSSAAQTDTAHRAEEVAPQERNSTPVRKYWDS